MPNTITMTKSGLRVGANPIIPYIEGDGTGPDIWRATVRVLDGAVKAAYGNERKIEWLEVLAGEKSFNRTGEWLPQATIEAFSKYLVGIKGPLTTPVGGGIRSLNVAIRQELDLYVCQRPVQYFAGVPSPVKAPEKVDMVIFRENTEDIYAGIEFQQGTEACTQFLALFKENFPKLNGKIRFPETSGIGIKPVSKDGTGRLVKSAIEYAIANDKPSRVTEGNSLKYSEG
ncbi:MAG: isocitrate/isopropylmalate family dehydrogenase, partial [Lentisphaeria bacterium]|nr:isocitrate/isopropylmalate family dehydrogenase [Lentisphaeria bacterium]